MRRGHDVGDSMAVWRVRVQCQRGPNWSLAHDRSASSSRRGKWAIWDGSTPFYFKKISFKWWILIFSKLRCKYLNVSLMEWECSTVDLLICITKKTCDYLQQVDKGGSFWQPKTSCRIWQPVGNDGRINTCPGFGSGGWWNFPCDKEPIDMERPPFLLLMDGCHFFSPWNAHSCGSYWLTCSRIGRNGCDLSTLCLNQMCKRWK